MAFVIRVWDSFIRIMTDVWVSFAGIMRQFTYKDAIDIVLVALLIYGAIKLIRETRAAQLFKGIIIIAFAFFISSQLELFVLTSILDYFFQFTWVALLIIFQPELRSALEKMGRSGVGKKIGRGLGGIINEKDRWLSQMRRCINAVVTSAAAFQNGKVGALMVFERDTKLGEIVETGTVINAEPSYQLIANIFYNKAPLHDGGMLLRGGMVYAAGCILPLTHNDTLKAELGTRHRAAIGVSEVSDAVVVVVSEETGQISIAVNGVLTRDYTRDTLRGELESLLLGDVLTDDKKTQHSSRRRSQDDEE